MRNHVRFFLIFITIFIVIIIEDSYSDLLVDMDASIKKIASFLSNGKFQYGFVADADRGLSRDEFVTVPFGSVRNEAGKISTIADPAAYARDVMDCLISDAATVAKMAVSEGISEKLMPFIAANRAHAFACGWLTEETVVENTNKTGPQKQSIYTAHPHIAEAAVLGSQIGTLATFMASVNYYNTNHNTGGPMLSKAFLKTIRSVLNIGPSDGVSDVQITTAVRLAGHASDKRRTLEHLVTIKGDTPYIKTESYRKNYTPQLDTWASIRSAMNPAGTHIFGVLKETVRIVCKHGLGGLSPVPAAIAALEVADKELSASGPLAHPGARYLFGVDPVGSFATTEAKALFGEIGSFLVSARKGKSITGAPHLMSLIDEYGTSVWKSAGRIVLDEGIADNAAIKSAVNSCGVHIAEAVPDPTTDPDSYKEFNASLLARINLLG